jgi:hypothetical protein
MKKKIIKILESYEDSLNMIEYTKYESIANDIIDLFKFTAYNEYEVEELNKQLSQAIDAAGAQEKRAREAEEMVRDMDRGYLKLGLHG